MTVMWHMSCFLLIKYVAEFKPLSYEDLKEKQTYMYVNLHVLTEYRKHVEDNVKRIVMYIYKSIMGKIQCLVMVL